MLCWLAVLAYAYTQERNENTRNTNPWRIPAFILNGSELDMRRTGQQNKALHKYCELLAQALSDSGLDMRTLVKLPITPTKENVKSELIHPVMKSLFPEIRSTADLSSKQMTELYEVMNMATSQRLGIAVRWPSIEELMYG